MTISILSYHFGLLDRGAETWAKSLITHSPEKISVLSQGDAYKPWKWVADIVVPTNGRLQVLLARLFCKRIVVFGHSGPGADDKWNLWCSPNVFVAFTAAQGLWANKFKLPWTKVVVIPHAVDTQIFKPTNSKKTIDVLCVAANSPDKRVDLVKQASKELVFKVVGSDQPIQVPFEQMPKVYNEAKVFCFVPKPHEAFGLVYLEAMACNVPVVAPDDPIRREIVGDGGIIISDLDKLSEAIKTALNTKWGNKPRLQAEKFSWNTISKLYTKLWTSL